MAQKNTQKMYVAALNVSSEPPFSPERYVNLFEILANAETAPVGVFGRERVTLYQYTHKDGYIVGTFGRYTQIDQKEPWWDSGERKALVDSEGRPIEQVRPGIDPNFQEISFIFMLAEHKLIFDLDNVTPHQFFKAVQSIISNATIEDLFGVVNVTLMPAANALEQVIKRPNIRSIRLLLTIPNPDGNSELEERIMSRFNHLKAGKSEQKYTSQKDESIVPDEELEATATLATRNGYVESTGFDESEGKLTTLSTRQYPWKGKITHTRSDLRTRTLELWAEWLVGKIKGL